MKLPQITIYTDGGCSPNPGPGGWGAVLLRSGQKPLELNGGEEETTNNRMELTAALKVLEALEQPHRVELFTDSTYVKQGITSWIKGWQAKGWRTANRKPVKNKDLWQPLAKEVDRHEVSWHWVKGHSGNQWNERADELATRGRGSDELPVHDEDAVYIYTAISFKQKESCGIIVDLLRYGNHTRILECAVAETTSNNLHILSAVEGLKALRRRLPVHIFTNSSYLRDGAANWLPGWQRRNWQTREGNPVSNRDSWIELAEQLDRYPVQFHVVDKELPPCAMQEAKEMTRELIKS